MATPSMKNEPVISCSSVPNSESPAQAYPAHPLVRGLKLPFTVFDRAAFVQQAVYSTAWITAFKMGK